MFRHFTLRFCGFAFMEIKDVSKWNGTVRKKFRPFSSPVLTAAVLPNLVFLLAKFWCFFLQTTP
jgi:hypothetical protein